MLLIVLGPGTLGVLPAVPVAHGHGRAVNAAESTPTGWTAGSSRTDLGDEVLVGVGVGQAALATVQMSLEERSAQFTRGGDGPTNGDAARHAWSTR